MAHSEQFDLASRKGVHAIAGALWVTEKQIFDDKAMMR